MSKPVGILVIWLIALLSSPSVAAEVLVSGKIKNIKYELRDDTLFFSGEGKIPVIHGDNGWLKKYRIGIHHLVFGEGITEVNSIGNDLTTKRVSRSSSGSSYANAIGTGLPNVRSITLPSTLKKIGRDAFSGMHFESIRLPEGLEEIGREAFYGSDLTTVKIPESVRKIGYQAFSGCKKLLCFDFNCAKVNVGSGCFFTTNGLRMLLHGNNVVSVTIDSFMGTPFEILDEYAMLDALHSDGIEYYINANIVPRKEFTGSEEQYARLQQKLASEYYDAECQKAEVVLKLDTFLLGKYNRKTGIMTLQSTNHGSFDVPLESFEHALKFKSELPDLISTSTARFEPDGDRVRFVSLTISFNNTDLTLYPIP